MRDSKDIPQLIDEICTAALDPERWLRVLERLAQSFGCSAVYLAKDSYAMTEGAFLSSGTDPVFARHYADYYAARNVLWPRIQKQPLGKILTDRILMPRSEFRRSEFFNDFLSPQDAEELLLSVALMEEDAGTTFVLSRPERFGSWQPKQMRMLAALRPHLRHALLANQYIGGLRIVNDFASEALYGLGYGLISVDAQARVVFANRTAEALLGDSSALRIERRRLAARRPTDTAALRRLVACAAHEGGDGSIVIRREERPSLMIIILPLKARPSSFLPTREGAVILIKDLERTAAPRLTAFTQYFGLTPAQTALAQEIARGRSVAAAGTHLGVSYATVRTHLLQIFQKTGTSRQAELVRLMLEWNEARSAAGSTAS
ncbi:MAG TPA: helix-turn-helix transcriptional regulator [Xanthobacteraceae bacterium]|nr:helix-turn-helix transcriptional regulator [Xanthobacteraceae bacterium]